MKGTDKIGRGFQNVRNKYPNVSATKIKEGIEHFLLPTDTNNAESEELLKHSKIDKNAPTCFGLHRDHLQGAKVSTWLKITCYVKSRYL